MTVKAIIVILIVAVVLLLGCVAALNAAYGHIRKNYEDLAKSYHEIEDLNAALRSQRHDQLNHLQVVYGMMELEEYEEMKNYLRPIYKECQKTGKALKTSRPAINALLMAKGMEAESRRTDFYVEVKTGLKGLKIPDWELCKVLSNLIDNALTALEEKPDDRVLRVDMNESREAFIFEIANNGPEIPADMINVIFKQGVTTKKDNGHGMGLAIVRKTLSEYDGEVNCESGPEETVFTVKIKK